MLTSPILELFWGKRPFDGTGCPVECNVCWFELFIFQECSDYGTKYQVEIDKRAMVIFKKLKYRA